MTHIPDGQFARLIGKIQLSRLTTYSAYNTANSDTAGHAGVLSTYQCISHVRTSLILYFSFTVNPSVAICTVACTGCTIECPSILTGPTTGWTLVKETNRTKSGHLHTHRITNVMTNRLRLGIHDIISQLHKTCLLYSGIVKQSVSTDFN